THLSTCVSCVSSIRIFALSDLSAGTCPRRLIDSNSSAVGSVAISHPRSISLPPTARPGRAARRLAAPLGDPDHVPELLRELGHHVLELSVADGLPHCRQHCGHPVVGRLWILAGTF